MWLWGWLFAVLWVSSAFSSEKMQNDACHHSLRLAHFESESTKNDPLALWEEWKVQPASEIGGLIPNGGLPFANRYFLECTEDHKRQSAEWELWTAQAFSEAGEVFLGVGDVSVGRTLDRRYDQKIASRQERIASYPDLLSLVWSRRTPVFRLREIKTGRLGYHSVIRAVQQLQSGVKELLRRVPDAEIDVVELVLGPWTDGSLYSGREYRPGRNDLRLRGKAVTVRVGKKLVPITLLKLPQDPRPIPEPIPDHPTRRAL